MRGADQAVWERSFPVRYLLVQEDEDGEERYWGRCAAVEGMFADKVPPPREVLTLRGCTPEGPLRDALSPGGEGTGLLGDVRVEVWDEEQPLQWWTLVDTVVLAHHPNRSDPALVDVVVGAGVEEEHAWVHTLPAEPAFKVFAGTTTTAAPAGQCQDVDGLFVHRYGPRPVPMHLIGCEAAEPLRALLSRRRKDDRDWVQLRALDRHGRVMYRHSVYLRIETARPSVLGADLWDIKLTGGGRDRPPLLARPVWESWYRGIPTSRNQWAPYTTEGRAEWLDLTASGMNDQGPDRSGGVHHLDGRFVTDVPGLHCAMAEALVGPGGYFGREWNAFKDCLGGGFGIALPFTLIWHDSHIAQRAFADDISDVEEGLTYFEEIVQLLERYGATVDLRAEAAVDGEDVRRAVSLAVGVLRNADPRAWEAKAGTLDWTCWETLEHLADDLFTYAARFGLARPPRDALLPFRTSSDRSGGPANVLFVDRDSGPEGLLTVVEACGGLLASVLRTAPAATVAHHVFGPSDPQGFAAMGVVETLVHTHDIAQGLNLEWSPPRELCERVLQMLFPHVVIDGDAWDVLLWATGRKALPGRPQLTDWRWYGTQGR